jgi:hypothetical protein
MTQGIDMGRSGWDNPDGFKPQERETVPMVEVSACEAAGPDGWVCDLPPGHRGEIHRAELGPTWPKINPDYHPLEPVEPPVTLPPSEADRTALAKVRRVTLEASDSDRAIVWAAALAEIERLTRGY